MLLFQVSRRTLFPALLRVLPSLLLSLLPLPLLHSLTHSLTRSRNSLYALSTLHRFQISKPPSLCQLLRTNMWTFSWPGPVRLTCWTLSFWAKPVGCDSNFNFFLFLFFVLAKDTCNISLLQWHLLWSK